VSLLHPAGFETMGSSPFNPDQKVVKAAEIVETKQLKTAPKKSMVPLSLIMNGFLSKKNLKGLSGKKVSSPCRNQGN
jgi:hypothetical protein